MRENQNKQSGTIVNYFDSQTITFIVPTYIMHTRNTWRDILKKRNQDYIALWHPCNVGHLHFIFNCVALLFQFCQMHPNGKV